LYDFLNYLCIRLYSTEVTPMAYTVAVEDAEPQSLFVTSPANNEVKGPFVWPSNRTEPANLGLHKHGADPAWVKGPLTSLLAGEVTNSDCGSASTIGLDTS
jgi:hypothetical protein